MSRHVYSGRNVLSITYRDICICNIDINTRTWGMSSIIWPDVYVSDMQPSGVSQHVTSMVSAEVQVGRHFMKD